MAMSGSSVGAPAAADVQPAETTQPYTVQRGPRVGYSSKNDESPALANMRRLPPTQGRSEEHENANPSLPAPRGSIVKDPVVQSSVGGASAPAMPGPLLSFPGMSRYNGGRGWPPDTNGAVGNNYYVQMVNSSFSIWNTGGGHLYGPAAINTLWQGFGGICESNNDGDPIVLYDKSFGRWLISQFALDGSDHIPSWECIAISTGPNPLGSWYRYAFLMSVDDFYDYPHFGIWPYGYFMSANIIRATNPGAAVAFDRNRMVQGLTASYQIFNVSQPGMLPSDWDGNNVPVVGSPNYFMAQNGSDQLKMYRYYVDFQNSNNSHFDGPTTIFVAPFNTSLCGDPNANCIPQPENGVFLNTTTDRLMFRLAYRNFGDHESLVLNHTVAAPSGYAGVRWYEIRDPGAAYPTVYQQGTYAPADNRSRWLGSIAQDRDGNIALGFSVSGFYPYYPSVAYAGRLATDPLGQLAQGENLIVGGSGSQTILPVQNEPRNRWGDYSSLTLDPGDDCTFWYTNQFYTNTGTDWQTRIGSFKFPSCGQVRTSTPTSTATPTITLTPTATNTPSCDTRIVTASITNALPTHINYVNIDGVASVCGTSEACPGVVSDNNNYHYNTHTYSNPSGAPICVTVTIDPSACGQNSYGLESYAYLTSFNPNNLCANYLADYGRQIITTPRTYSFTVPAGATFVIDVEEYIAGNGCGSYTLIVSGLPCATPTLTRTATSTVTPTYTATPPAAVINGHLTWDGISQPNARNAGLTATLSLCVNGAPANYTVTTDQNGNFTLMANLVPGTYNWRIKGIKWLANSGTLTYAGPPMSVEFGQQKAGDVDSTHNNVITTADFNVVKGVFGLPNSVGDLNNDGVTTTVDFNLLKTNFGTAGTPANCP
jgi:hypothetical protein